MPSGSARSSRATRRSPPSRPGRSAARMDERTVLTGDDRFLWAARAWPEVRAALESGKLVALLPIGATEAHGPHLALDADVAIASGVALRAARALERDGYQPLVLPPIQYTVTDFAAEFAGTIG